MISNYKFIILKLNFFKNILENFNININFIYLNIFFFNIFLKKTFNFYNILLSKIILLKLKNFIEYYLKINFSKSNVFINITNYKGISIFILNSGLFNFKGSQKTKKLALNFITRKLNFISINVQNKNFLISFKGLKLNKKFIFNKIKNFLILKGIINYNLKPFNGCKPKKLKRKKHNKNF